MIFTVSATQLQTGACATWNAPAGFYRSAVIVNTVELNLKGPNRRENQARLQGGAIRLVELVEGSTEPIIREPERRLMLKADRTQIQGRDPLRQFIKRILGYRQIHHQQHQGIHDPGALPSREIKPLGKNLPQAHAADDGVNQR